MPDSELPAYAVHWPETAALPGKAVPIKGSLYLRILLMQTGPSLNEGIDSLMLNIGAHRPDFFPGTGLGTNRLSSISMRHNPAGSGNISPHTVPCMGNGTQKVPARKSHFLKLWHMDKFNSRLPRMLHNLLGPVWYPMAEYSVILAEKPCQQAGSSALW